MTQKRGFPDKGLPTANHQSPDLAGGWFYKQFVGRTDQLLKETFGLTCQHQIRRSEVLKCWWANEHWNMCESVVEQNNKTGDLEVEVLDNGYRVQISRNTPHGCCLGNPSYWLGGQCSSLPQMLHRFDSQLQHVKGFSCHTAGLVHYLQVGRRPGKGWGGGPGGVGVVLSTF